MGAKSFQSGWGDYVNHAAVGNVPGLLARLTGGLATRKRKAVAQELRAVVTVASKRGRKAAAWIDDGQETPPEVKTFFDRMIRPSGALPPD
jgi:hypothetical protein